MRLLDRYLLRELLVPLAYCLCGFLLFWISSDLITSIKELQEKRMLAGDIVEYYVVRTPEFLVIVLPIGLLLALLYALTNHARHQEITAIRAAGVSLWRLSAPYLGVGLLASGILFALNEYLAPDSAERAEAIKERRMPPAADANRRNQVQLNFTNSRERRVWRAAVYDSQSSQMTDVHLNWSRPDGSHLWLSAERAARVKGVWTFYNASELREAPNSRASPVPFLQTNWLAMPEFAETPEEINSYIKISNSMSLRAAKRADVPISEILHYLRLHPQPKRLDRCWLYTKLHGRLAAPWTCVVVVLIAIPFGAAFGRRNVFVGVASSIVICFAYFVLQQLALALGTNGQVPPWLAAWSPNLVFGGVGFWLTATVR